MKCIWHAYYFRETMTDIFFWTIMDNLCDCWFCCGGHYATPGHIKTGVTRVWPLSPLPAPSGTNTGSHCFINIFRSTNTFSRVVVSFVKISPAANKNTMVDIKTSFHAAICINLYKSPRRLMWPCLVKRQAKSIPYTISPRSLSVFFQHVFSMDK